MAGQTRPLHVSLVAIPDAAISTLAGIYDVLGSFAMLARVAPSVLWPGHVLQKARLDRMRRDHRRAS